ncbi:metallophosphoesterase [Sediminicola luteus]|uniref:metallophosphoesterase n=1 Tax=Sediminicola luteus TaxID=319238 RepID=UPI00155813EB|nr:metallophosphoesterase [Sediminicola luteus]
MIKIFKKKLISEKWKKGLLFSVPIISLALSILGYSAALTPYIIEIQIPISANNFKDLTIVQLSDIHLSRAKNRNWFPKVVETVNRQKADIIVITGDFADMVLPDEDNILDDFGRLKAKYGVFGVLGNHEYYGGQVKEWSEKLNALGVSMLENEHKIIDHKGSQVLLAGVTDYIAESRDLPIPDITKALSCESPASIKILLSHQAKNLEFASMSGVDLQLSGLTHAGQFFPFNLLIGFAHKYVKGLYKINNMYLYINQGTGYWDIPNRLGTQSEITLFTLKSNN